MSELDKFKTSDEDHVKHCENFIKNLANYRGSGQTFCTISLGDDFSKIKIMAGMCHAGYKVKEGDESKLRATCSGLTPSLANIPLALKVWEWVSSPQSPWKIIFEKDEIKLIQDDNGPLGYVIWGETLRNIPFNFIKNFAILMRSVTERVDQWKTWYYLVSEKKVHPTEAFYICSVFTRISNTDELTPVDLRSGGHWALSDGIVSKTAYIPNSYNVKSVSTLNIDWKIFKSGDIPNLNTIKNPQINGYFIGTKKCDINLTDNTPRYTYHLFDSSKVRQNISSGISKFGILNRNYKIDDVLDYFYKYKDMEGFD